MYYQGRQRESCLQGKAELTKKVYGLHRSFLGLELPLIPTLGTQSLLWLSNISDASTWQMTIYVFISRHAIFLILTQTAFYSSHVQKIKTRKTNFCVDALATVGMDDELVRSFFFLAWIWIVMLGWRPYQYHEPTENAKLPVQSLASLGGPWTSWTINLLVGCQSQENSPGAAQAMSECVLRKGDPRTLSSWNLFYPMV